MTSLSFRLIYIICVSLCFAGLNSAHEASSRDLVLYMALQSKGILTLSFNASKPVADSIQILETDTQAGFMPGWITQYHEDFYSVSRTKFPAPDSVQGEVFAFRKSGRTNLNLLNSLGSGGDGAVYVDVSTDGRTISVANMSVKCVLSEARWIC